jgi:hypothetical protein
MNSSLIQLNDLPDEILLIIFKKISNIDVLYSFIGVNKRLNQIVHDSTFTNCITLIHRSSNGLYYRLINRILDRFCSDILPEIHHKIKWLNVEALSVKRILLSTNYPNLYGLGIYNIEEKTASHIFTSKRFRLDFFSQSSIV